MNTNILFPGYLLCTFWRHLKAKFWLHTVFVYIGTIHYLRPRPSITKEMFYNKMEIIDLFLHAFLYY